MKHIATITTTTRTKMDRDGNTICRTTTEEYTYYYEPEDMVDNGDGSWSYQPKHLQPEDPIKEVPI